MDEFQKNLEDLLRLVTSGQYTRIGVYARPGEGKTHLLQALKEKLGEDSDWEVFIYEESTIDTIEPPYVLPIVDPYAPTFNENPEKAPEVFFVLKYSDKYKMRVSGVNENLGPLATMRDYMKKAKEKSDLKIIQGPRVLVGPDALRNAFEEA